VEQFSDTNIINLFEFSHVLAA